MGLLLGPWGGTSFTYLGAVIVTEAQTQKPHLAKSLDSDRFGKVSRLINIAAIFQGHIVGKQLEGHHRQ